MICKLFALVFAVAGFAGVAFGQLPFPQRCFDSPGGWSGHFHRIDYSSGHLTHGYMYYNRTELRILYAHEPTVDVPQYEKHWIFFNLKKSYRYYETDKTCKIEDIPSDEYFPTYGAPRGSEYVHRDRLGAYTYNLGVTTDYFRMRTETGGTYRGFYAPVTDSSGIDFNCVPVIESYENIDTIPTYQRNMHWTYMNITTFPNPSAIWDLPDACRERE
ncbi:PREDICTED: uncharacterized protein LOC109581771 isoform X4 [Amphimedon queenslandica]|uniref:Uncharacterized protein n=2 Tax=Amphimedon queenslandica TaxID=400682 RepID=A0AAN0J4U9_AMPQE|nr:PREDICTED: uncharacterized protein LOC109581771 isoform X4 [Amphimedon queenslandica]|eukprot:XP_019851738.1 PREDICTED: uncharacterized protein LOC109581771 isoform X4 [Amphimedon queenslandica]